MNDRINYSVSPDSPSIKTIHRDGFAILVVATYLEGNTVGIFCLERSEGGTQYHNKGSVLSDTYSFTVSRQVPENCRNRIFSYPKESPCVIVQPSEAEISFEKIYRHASKLGK